MCYFSTVKAFLTTLLCTTLLVGSMRGNDSTDIAELIEELLHNPRPFGMTDTTAARDVIGAIQAAFPDATDSSIVWTSSRGDTTLRAGHGTVHLYYEKYALDMVEGPMSTTSHGQSLNLYFELPDSLSTVRLGDSLSSLVTVRRRGYPVLDHPNPWISDAMFDFDEGATPRLKIIADTRQRTVLLLRYWVR